MRKAKAMTWVKVCLSAIAIIGISACRAPGMRFDQDKAIPRAVVTIDGIKVKLNSIPASLLKQEKSGVSSAAEFSNWISKGNNVYKVGPQDILMVTVWDHPELTLPLGQFRSDAVTGFVVDERGLLYYPYVGTFSVAGLTVAEIRESITNQLGRVLKNPQVDVKVLAYRSQYVFIGGEVRSPGQYPITDIPFSLPEAINRVGGFLPTSDQSKLIVTRGGVRSVLDFSKMVRSGVSADKIVLKHGDSVYIPSREEDPVYVMGEVRTPKSVPMYHGTISLAQALSDAGGLLLNTADAGSIYVLRKGEVAGEVAVFHLDARNPIGMVVADNFQLEPRDIVYVDAGALVRWNRVVSLIMPTLNALTGFASDAKYLSK